ncbi:D-alanine--D-alanine ligase family protein [Smaragdicoccus niigatensis]|nr:D-alanine--D-alanine ligase family protein [Smaragdicoccus niigatensis]
MPALTRVALIFGGRSNEHSVSVTSAGSVVANLDPERYEIIPVGISREGEWIVGAMPGAREDRTLPSVESDGSGVMLSAAAVEALHSADVIFPILHGPWGEDGTIQGVFEVSGKPYVGPGVIASAAGMDKEFTKKLLAAEGLPIGTQLVLRAGEKTLTAEQKEQLGLPVFVKPARGGSSIGISRVANWDDLDAAIAEARNHDPKVIIESNIVGREVECGVLEFPDGRVEASKIAEIRLTNLTTDESFYDFDTKYLDNVTEFDIPAHLDDETTAQIREIAVKAFKALDCQGLSRVDFFVTENGPVINEINTMPGFTSISMYPKMWAETGVDYPTLLSTLIETAIARGTGLR